MKKILSIANSPYSAFSLLVVSGALLAAILLSKQAFAVINVPTWDVTGNYNIGFQLTGDPTVYTHDSSLTQTGTSVSGSGGFPAGGPHTYHWVITSGSVSGNTITLTMDYDLGAPGTTMHMTGTIAADGSMSGTWDDNFGGARTGTWATSSGTAFRNIPEECTGMTFDNFIKGNGSDNTLNGTGGRDLILGLGGKDKINGSANDDCIDGGDGKDDIDAGSGNDVVVGGNNDDKINGNTGNDKLYGQGGADNLKGDSGDDLLNGGGDNDDMDGGSGGDTLIGAGGSGDKANGATGSDACSAETEKNCESDPV